MCLPPRCGSDTGHGNGAVGVESNGTREIGAGYELEFGDEFGRIREFGGIRGQTGRFLNLVFGSSPFAAPNAVRLRNSTIRCFLLYPQLKPALPFPMVVQVSAQISKLRPPTRPSDPTALPTTHHSLPTTHLVVNHSIRGF